MKRLVGVAAAAGLVLMAVLFFAGSWYLKARKFRQIRAAAIAGLERGDEGEVKANLVLLEEKFPDAPETFDIAKKLAKLQVDKRAQRSGEHLREGQQEWEAYQQRKGEVASLRNAWNEVVLDGVWVPIDASMRQTEVDATHVSFGSQDRAAKNLLNTLGKLSFRLIDVQTK